MIIIPEELIVSVPSVIAFPVSCHNFQGLAHSQSKRSCHFGGDMNGMSILFDSCKCSNLQSPDRKDQSFKGKSKPGREGLSVEGKG